MLTQNLWKTIFWTTFFSIAMALLESAVVVDLRALFYPDGFSFPLKPMEHDLAQVEFLRELATVVMLVAIAVLTGRSPAQRFAHFIYCFAIWDIFYYVWLYVFLQWPASLMEWDILFLIPVPWVGQVVTPLLVTGVMIVLAIMMLHFDEQGKKAMLNFKEWGIFILGSLVVILSWVWDFCKSAIVQDGWSAIWTLSGEDKVFDTANGYVPQEFPWWIFTAGMLIYGIGLTVYIQRNRKE